MKKHKAKSSDGKVSFTTIVKTLALRSAAKGKKKNTSGEVSKKGEVDNEVEKDESPEDEVTDIDEHDIQAQAFSFRQMATATNNFSSENLVGEGGFGRVYKGYLQAIDKVVAIKRLDRSGVQENKEFLSEVFMLSLVSHPNLVNFVGYCAHGDQRMLIHEFMPNGSLESHLLDVPPNEEALDWETRMKIAEGAAKGLQYLHEVAKPPIIYSDFNTSNILLDENFNSRLSDFGLAKMGPSEHKDNSSTRVMGTYGYCAPEYGITGQLTTKSDVYSFGVVFLELISGRRAIDPTKPVDEQNLVAWAEPLSKDRNMFAKMVDPKLGEKYPVKALHQALAVTAMCLQEEPTIRPLISDIVPAIESLTKPTTDPESPAQNPQSPIGDDHPEESPSDEPKNPTEEDGSSDELESPTGIIIRGNCVDADVHDQETKEG